jgi:hypothetical protein
MTNEKISAAQKVVEAARRIVREHQDNSERSDISWRGVFKCHCDLCTSILEYNRIKK